MHSMFNGVIGTLSEISEIAFVEAEYFHLGAAISAFSVKAGHAVNDRRLDYFWKP